MIRKAPHALDTEDLLKLIEQTDASKAVAPVNEPIISGNDVLTFLSVLNIQEGSEIIKKNTLFQIYKAWSKHPITRKDFFLTIGKFFPVKNGAYRINQNAIKLTHEAYLKFKRQNTKLNSPAWAKHFENFLLFHSLKHGDAWIELDIFYFLYDKYCHSQGLDKSGKHYMGKQVFEYYANLNLKFKITKYGKVYAISSNIANFFQPGQLQRMKEQHAKEKDPDKKETNKKKQTRKSRSRPKVQSKNKN